jgi:hypothetical protein
MTPHKRRDKKQSIHDINNGPRVFIRALLLIMSEDLEMFFILNV